MDLTQARCPLGQEPTLGVSPFWTLSLTPPPPVAKVKVTSGPGCRLAVIASCLSELSELA